jgi:Xaa-Pro aminopeptidase
MVDVLEISGTDMGRMGHGIGLNLTEPPSISQTDQTVLEAGMVVSIEPSVAFKVSGKGGNSEKLMVHEENLVVNDEGYTLLSRRASPEITVIR